MARKPRDKQQKKEYDYWYRKEHPDKVLKNAKLYQKRHPERVRLRKRAHYLNNKEAILFKNREWYRKNKKKDCANSSRWRRENPVQANAQRQRHKTKKTKAGGSFTAAEWKTLCRSYKYRCLCCGKRRKLTADHVIPVSKGGSSNIENIQPLCGPCNSSKNAKTTDYRKRKP